MVLRVVQLQKWQTPIFSWEPALGLANSQDAEVVKKKHIAIFGYKQ